MLTSVRALLSGIVDYAGLFPPAKLPLDEAFRNYLRYRTEPQSWMLGRFICPAARLGELTEFAGDIQSAGPLSISVLGRGGGDAKEFLEGVRADLADVRKFHERFGDKTAVTAYEAKLPPTLCQPHEENAPELFALVGATAILCETGWPGVVTPFYEPPGAGTETLQFMISVLGGDVAAAELGKRSRCRPCGLKLRCGGAEPASIPSADELAFAIAWARNQLPLKFTAGLHHPFAHFDGTSQTTMHGFLSLFAAGPLAYACGLGKSTIRKIIGDENPRRLQFSDSAVTWNTLSAPLPWIVFARERLVTSFGSCSFDEPRDDLRALGLIP